MRLLLDTHVLIWWDEGARLSRAAFDAIRDAEVVYVSAVSGWEITVKTALGRLKTRRVLAEAVAESGFEELPMRLHHAEELVWLPWLHKDPYDRMLIAQARSEGLAIVTRDARFEAYGIKLIHA